jgi:hypothetical protein
VPKYPLENNGKSLIFAIQLCLGLVLTIQLQIRFFFMIELLKLFTIGHRAILEGLAAVPPGQVAFLLRHELLTPIFHGWS